MAGHYKQEVSVEMINAAKEKLQTFFQGNLRYIVPFFQRPYVWDTDNWDSLWENINQVYVDNKQMKNSEHFIGTLITKHIPTDTLGRDWHDLIDGQQRLSTIAILLKSLADCCKGDLPNLKNRMNDLLLFKNAKGDQFFRLELSKNDMPYFKAIIQGDGVSVLPNQEHRLIEAYNYFKERVKDFSDEEIDVFVSVVLEKVPVISMLLSSDDDEQVIFDTINSLGVRLTTAELLKNYIFKEKRLQTLYTDLWEPVFDPDEETVRFWNKEKTAGRIFRTNIEVLLYCYLIIETQREIRLERLYKEYKEWLVNKTVNEKIAFLNSLKEYANYYFDFPEGEELNEIAYDEDEKRFFHIIENLSITTVYPLILFIYKEVTDINERKAILKLLESYLVRRNICRLTTKNYNNLFISIIQKLKKLRQDNNAVSVKDVSEILASFSEETNRFPNDAAFELAFRDTQLSNQNAREILFCIALYHKSSPLSDTRKLSSFSYSVEHFMPVKWQDNWMSPNIDENGKAVRNRTLKTLGNLTLVTKRLNSKLSNAAWDHKKGILRQYSSLSMTIDYLDNANWDEKSISGRSDDLFSKSGIKMWGYYK